MVSIVNFNLNISFKTDDIMGDVSILGNDIMYWGHGFSFSALPSNTLVSDFVRRKKKVTDRKIEIETFLKNKKVIFIIASESSYIRPSQGLGIYTEAFLPEALQYKFTKSVGRNFKNVNKDSRFNRLMKFIEGQSIYTGTLKLAPGYITLGHINGHPEAVLCAYRQHNDGHVFIVPDMAPWNANSLNEFFEIMEEVYSNLNKVAEKPLLPVYIEKIRFADEAENLNQITTYKNQISELQEKINTIENRNEVFNDYKILIGGKGEPLRIVVGRIFKNIGFEVDDKDSKGEDLVLKVNNKPPCAVEVKGKKSSSGCTDRRQLHDWVASYSSEHDIDAKGILIVNGYSETPINDRAVVYPDETVKKATKQGHCLISTIDLLAEYLATKYLAADPKDLIERLYSTEGIFISKYKIQDFLV